MFKRIRRVTGQSTRESGSFSSISKTQCTPIDPSRCSLLGLPSELRTAVYEHLAASTALTLPPIQKRRKHPPPPVAPLLVCRQISREYGPILLANAKMSFPIPRFDFTYVMSFLDELPPATLTALAANNRLNIVLSFSQVPERAELDSLCYWLELRSTDPEARTEQTTQFVLRFHYNVIIKLSTLTTAIGSSAQMRVAVLSSLIRQIPRLGDKQSDAEKKRMALDLARYRDELIGTERSDEERKRELDNSGSDALENYRRSFIPLQLR